MSKRLGGFDIQALREEEIEPAAILSLLAKIGTSDAVDLKTMKELIAEFDFKKFGRAAAIYDPEDLKRLTHKAVSHMDYAEVKNRVKVDKEFWDAVKPNLNKVSEAEAWRHICSDDLEPVVEDAEFLRAAAKHLPENLDFNEWMERLKKATGRKGRDLFMPIRKALTALDHGPELKNILPLIGRERILARLNG